MYNPIRELKRWLHGVNLEAYAEKKDTTPQERQTLKNLALSYLREYGV